jgi:SAM-dependent methyltransferase
MTIFHRLGFEVRYLFRAPWDSGIVSPELQAFIDGHPPGIALDLGCGTGTSSIALARAGWMVTGVDYSFLAIYKARNKAEREEKQPVFIFSDILHLPNQFLKTGFNLVLDIGCFHGLSAANKGLYLQQLDNLLSPEGNWLLYGFFKELNSSGPGLLEKDFPNPKGHLTLVSRKDGVDKYFRSNTWILFQMNEYRE